MAHDCTCTRCTKKAAQAGGCCVKMQSGTDEGFFRGVAF